MKPKKKVLSKNSQSPESINRLFQLKIKHAKGRISQNEQRKIDVQQQIKDLEFSHRSSKGLVLIDSSPSREGETQRKLSLEELSKKKLRRAINLKKESKQREFTISQYIKEADNNNSPVQSSINLLNEIGKQYASQYLFRRKFLQQKQPMTDNNRVPLINKSHSPKEV